MNKISTKKLRAWTYKIINHKSYFINRGFTLIELLVSMSIIAILATMSLFALRGARESARDGRRKSDLETIRSAIELYKADCGTYPTGTLPAGNSISATCGGGPAVTYLQSIPDDSVTGRDYGYNRTTTTTYALCTSLEDINPTPTAAPSDCASCGASVVCNYKVTNP